MHRGLAAVQGAHRLPRRCLDHILLSRELQVEHVQVPELVISDHLPVAVHIRRPGGLC